MEKLNELYQMCGFNNDNILIVANNILKIVENANLSKNSDNELVISYTKNKNKIILIIDKFSDIQYIREKDDNYIYKVYYFENEINYENIIKGK